MTGYKVSVVVPAYNAERTLARCVASILCQTLHEIRVIVVDDGSKDGTLRLAEDLAERDSRVCVLHQENAGCYMARLAGVKSVDTPYFGFVDADDWVEPQMYEHLLAFCQAHDLDIAECRINVGKVKTVSQPELFLGRAAVFDKVVYPRMWKGHGANTVWTKLYRVRNDFPKFEESFFSTWEDLIWNLQLFLPAERVGYLNEGLYNYEVTSGSSVRNFGERNVKGLNETLRVRRVLAGQYGLREDDLALAQWTVHNVRNMFVSAVSAPAESWLQRMNNVKRLLAIPEVKEAMDVLTKKGMADSDLAFMRRIHALPLTLAVFGVRLAKLSMRMLKR